MLISFYELQILLVHYQILIYSFDLLIVFKSASRVGAKAWPWQSFQYYGHHGHLLILINLLTPEPGVGRRMDTNKARWRQGNHCPGYACYHNCTTFTKPIRMLMSSKIQNLARHFLSTNEKSLNKQEIEKYIQKKWRSNRLQSILCLHI